jgi:hypothetical protein
MVGVVSETAIPEASSFPKRRNNVPLGQDVTWVVVEVDDKDLQVRNHCKVQSFSPSRRKNSRTESALRCCRWIVRCQVFSLAGIRFSRRCASGHEVAIAMDD